MADPRSLLSPTPISGTTQRLPIGPQRPPSAASVGGSTSSRAARTPSPGPNTALPFGPSPKRGSSPGPFSSIKGHARSPSTLSRPGTIYSAAETPSAPPSPIAATTNMARTSFTSPNHSTHAAGISHPSFLRAVRPPQTYPRPPLAARPLSQISAGSSRRSSFGGLHPPPLIGPTTEQFSDVEPDGDEISYHGGASSTDGHQPPSHGVPPQKSREPLLPLSHANRDSSSSNTTTRPFSLSQPPHRRHVRDSSEMSTPGAMRTSLDRLFKRLSAGSAGPSDGGPPVLQLHTASPVTRSPGITPMEKHMEEDGQTTDTSPRTSMQHSHVKKSLRITSAPTSAASTFQPSAPAQTGPPLQFTPVLDAASGRRRRRHELHPSRNRFFLRGRLLTGGDQPWAFAASVALVLGVSGTWFGTTCVWWWTHVSPAVAAVGAYMCLLTISSMFATAMRDPGILPRNLDPDPPVKSGGSTGTGGVPLPRDLPVRAGVVRVKYCATCKTYRPPRSSHCRMCDNCVEGCDHHCQWVNNCVGHRNYTSFFTFLTAAVTTVILIIVTSAIHLFLLTRPSHGHLSFAHALRTSSGSGSAAAFVLCMLVIWPLSALLLYHVRLLLLNVTTIEQIRNSAQRALGAGRAENPFALPAGPLANAAAVLARPEGRGWLRASGGATEDRREVNPGMKVQ